MIRCKVGFLVCVFALLTPVLLLASPSGLNNIPTADFAPQGTLVLQAYSSFQSDSKTSGTLGAKYGVGYGLEIGADWQGAASPTGPLTLQVKKTWPVADADTRFCLGLANINTNTGDNPLYPYAVVSQKLAAKWRGHAGYAPQKDNKQWFLGTDYTLPCGTMLRSDYVHGTTNDFNLYSLGALVPTKFGAVEGWVSRNCPGGAGSSNATIYTLKLDYAFQP